ncbi:hypothetical protein BT69DRAFT_1288368, partial [Atractiella rhizophila]
IARTPSPPRTAASTARPSSTLAQASMVTATADSTAGLTGQVSQRIEGSSDWNRWRCPSMQCIRFRIRL